MNELPKAYNPSDYEDAMYTRWEASGFFNPDGLSGEPYSILMPPPNVTGVLHLGHALENTLMDTMIRFERMRGKKALLLPGTDHAAVATQAKVEDLLVKEGIAHPRETLGREKLLERIRVYAEESKKTIIKQIRKMGTSADWSRLAYTFDDARSRAVNEMFVRMHTDGLIYRGYRVVNWSVKGQSTCSDDELVYVERTGKLYYFKYSHDFPMTIATTRPETKLGDTAVAVHPNDERYKQYIGKTFTVDVGAAKPLSIKIITNESIDPSFGTGALGVTPAHSQIDFDMYEIQKAKEDPIDFVSVIGIDGHMTADAGPAYVGLPVLEAREKFVSYLQDQGLLEKEEEIEQNVGTSDRFGDVVEAIPMTQWFVAVNKKIPGPEKTLKELMREAVATGHNGDPAQKITITPERFEKTYFQWIDNLRDWCISRQIWWGHQIPVVYDISDFRNSRGVAYFEIRGGIIPIDEKLEGEIKRDVPGMKITAIHRNRKTGESRLSTASFNILTYLVEKNLVTWEQIHEQARGFRIDECESYRAIVNQKEALPSEVQDPDTLDTWFSSGLWTFSTFGWPTTTVYFVRHGEAENNVQNILNDAADDTEYSLTKKGKKDIATLAKTLVDKSVDVIITSPVRRAKETAEILREALGIPVIVDARLREVGMGELNGKDESELDILREEKDWKTTSPKGIESYTSLQARTHECMQELLGRYQGKRIAIVSHGDTLGALKQFGTQTADGSGLLHHLQKRGTAEKRVFTTDNTQATDLELFHPSSWIQMGYEILFFWMARMILMSTYALDQIPFRDVYIHGILRDKDGRKFSKSLGNGIDPLDVIATYGTDALRFSLLVGISPGNDARFYLEKVEGAQHLVNKLWNISRFILLQQKENNVTIKQFDNLSLADEWILSRLTQLIIDVTTDLEQYRFSAAGERLRDFTWNEFADWYIEIAKIEGEKSAILLYILETLLKLWHPFMPFVTEAIWREWKGDSNILMSSPWPRDVETPHGGVSKPDSFSLLQDIVTSIRSLRADYHIPPGKKLSVFFQSKEHTLLLEKNKHIIEGLARVETRFIASRDNQSENENTTRDAMNRVSTGFVVHGIEVSVDLAAAIDIGKEKTRLQKELDAVTPYILSLEKKLSNENFLSGAPETVVALEKEKLQTAQEKKEKIEKQLAQLANQ